MPKKSVFISHVTAEAAVAEALKRSLEQALDVSAFASSTDINLGARWLSEIDNALDAADAVLVLCSRWSVARRWINFEVGAGWGQKKPVIPLCHGTMGTEELPDLLQALQGQNIHNAADCEQLVTRLGKNLDCLTKTGFDYFAMAASLRPQSPPRQPVIAMDLSHGQAGWPRPPDRLRPESEQTIFGLAENSRTWRFFPITSVAHFLSKPFWEAAGLVVASPFRARISSEIVDIISQWVFGGGRLLLLGFELGDLHHGANLCDLTNQFGIQLHTDIVGPPNYQGEKPYGVPVQFLVSQAEEHPLTEGMNEISITNSQTLSVAPGGSEWLRVGSNVVYRPRADTVDYFENTLIQPQSKQCVPVPDVGGTPVAVQAPAGLCGAGAVCAIGTWQIRNNNPETQMLVERLLNWLATGHVHGKP
jgi:TIR domain